MFAKNLLRSVATNSSIFTLAARTNVTVSAGLVKKLRDMTGAPMIECKKALTHVLSSEEVDNSTESNTMDAASEYLRKRGSALAANKASRTAKEGVVVLAVDKDSKKGSLVEINCETDFVARNGIFLAFAVRTALAALENKTIATTLDTTGNAKDVVMDTLNSVVLPDGPVAMATNPNAASNTVSAELIDVITTCRENIKVRRAGIVEVPEGKAGFIAPYIHNELPIPDDVKSYIDSIIGSGCQLRIGAAAALATVEHVGERDQDMIDLTRKICMQAVAARPSYLARDNVPAEAVNKEKAFIIESSNLEGKDAKVVDRLVDGKLNKFYEGIVLLDQPFLITNDTKKPKISELLAAHNGKPVVTQLLRFQRGEGAPEGTEE